MIEKLSCVFATDTNPYKNLALEEYLLHIVDSGECILYLWQNEKTVVIGRNQNCWKECHVTELEETGGHLARRLSGGGAVYHGLGNLNFTFLVPCEDFDVGRQTEVILEAVRSFGIDAERTGRNDLTVDGRKFSGNAYYRTDRACYHHGTLLLQDDSAEMEKYLSVSREKLRAKSVDSVRARVCCLAEYCEGITASAMQRALLIALSQVYGLPFSPLEDARLDYAALAELAEKYASPEWKYGRRLPFEYELGRRFSWGEVLLQLHVENGRIADLAVWSDALDTGYSGLVRDALLNTAFEAKAICAALRAGPAADETLAKVLGDTRTLLLEAM